MGQRPMEAPPDDRGLKARSKSSNVPVLGEAILGNNIFRDLIAGVTDIVGGRSGVYESNLKHGRQIAIGEMLLEARALGADAVVAVDIDYETVGAGMLMICASGTAVILEGEGR